MLIYPLFKAEICVRFVVGPSTKSKIKFILIIYVSIKNLKFSKVLNNVKALKFYKIKNVTTTHYAVSVPIVWENMLCFMRSICSSI